MIPMEVIKVIDGPNKIDWENIERIALCVMLTCCSTMTFFLCVGISSFVIGGVLDTGAAIPMYNRIALGILSALGFFSSGGMLLAARDELSEPTNYYPYL